MGVEENARSTDAFGPTEGAVLVRRRERTAGAADADVDEARRVIPIVVGDQIFFFPVRSTARANFKDVMFLLGSMLWQSIDRALKTILRDSVFYVMNARKTGFDHTTTVM